VKTNAELPFLSIDPAHSRCFHFHSTYPYGARRPNLSGKNLCLQTPTKETKRVV
jgi:hypothetical protein